MIKTTANDNKHLHSTTNDCNRVGLMKMFEICVLKGGKCKMSDLLSKCAKLVYLLVRCFDKLSNLIFSSLSLSK